MSAQELAQAMTLQPLQRKRSAVYRRFCRKKLTHNPKTGCISKTRYQTKRAAMRQPYAGAAYACQFCGGWHATS